jgi:hypothetical protein
MSDNATASVVILHQLARGFSADWIFMPAALLFVPTGCFLVIVAGHPWGAAYLTTLATIERVVLLPLWVVVWVLFAFGLGLFRLYPPHSAASPRLAPDQGGCRRLGRSRATASPVCAAPGAPR